MTHQCFAQNFCISWNFKHSLEACFSDFESSSNLARRQNVWKIMLTKYTSSYCIFLAPPADSPLPLNHLYVLWGSPHFYRSWAGSDPCSMMHVACDSSSHVVAINLNSNLTQVPPVVITGSFPTLLLTLTGLTFLKLRNNALSGPIPLQLTSLSNLVVLDLANNLFTGVLPQHLFFTTTTVPGWTNGQYIGSNQQMTSFNIMISLDISNNLLTQTIPRQLSLLSSLIYLNLSHNRFTGTLPGQFSSMQTLADMAFDFNLLSQAIPSQLSFLWFVSTLSLSHNQLTGSIPDFLSTWMLLNKLELSNNILTGTLSKQFSGLTNLTMLSLSGNKLRGTIPPEFSALNHMNSLLLGNNGLDGTLPLQLSVLSALSVMDVSNNKISGLLPPQYLKNLSTCTFHCDNTLMCGLINGFTSVTVVGSRLGIGNNSGESILLYFSGYKQLCIAVDKLVNAEWLKWYDDIHVCRHICRQSDQTCDVESEQAIQTANLQDTKIMITQTHICNGVGCIYGRFLQHLPCWNLCTLLEEIFNRMLQQRVWECPDKLISS